MAAWGSQRTEYDTGGCTWHAMDSEVGDECFTWFHWRFQVLLGFGLTGSCKQCSLRMQKGITAKLRTCPRDREKIFKIISMVSKLYIYIYVRIYTYSPFVFQVTIFWSGGNGCFASARKLCQWPRKSYYCWPGRHRKYKYLMIQRLKVVKWDLWDSAAACDVWEQSVLLRFCLL